MQSLSTLVAGLFISLACSQGFGAFLGVDLPVMFAYQDNDGACRKSDQWMGVSITGTIKNGKLVQGILQQSFSPEVRTRLLASELADIEVGVDVREDSYIAKWKISPRLLVWVFSHIDRLPPPLGCRPTQGFATVAPFGHTYHFFADFPMGSTSGVKRFRGVRRDGTPYVVRLGFHQRQSD